MFNKHPKGLILAALSNMGERFGFYLMMATLTLFLSAKFGLSDTNASLIYSVFYFLIYILAFVGGLIADKTRHYKTTVLSGLILMALGYLTIALPTPNFSPHRTLFLIITCFGLFMIAFGNGLFKGNLQALVGQLYNNERYGAMRDSGFSLFYVFINVGAIFAPLAASAVRNGWLATKGFIYNPDLPNLCHGFLDHALNADAMQRFVTLSGEVSRAGVPTDLAQFAHNYVNAFATGFHFAFVVAVLGMLISLAIYLRSKRYLSAPAAATSNEGKSAPTMSPAEVKQRIWALLAVIAVVIFFWFSFHQNGVTLNYFARDYTQLHIGSFRLTTEMFQSANPFFVVFLTPVVLALFGWLRARGKEPTTPGKIAIGMGIAAVAYIVMCAGSLGLPPMSDIKAVGGLQDAQRVTPFLLIVTYLILTFAELFISPLGISFVSKVAPPQYQGIMQGGWLASTAVGNQLLFIGTITYNTLPLWVTWGMFTVACLISMSTMLILLRWLNRVTE